MFRLKKRFYLVSLVVLLSLFSFSALGENAWINFYSPSLAKCGTSASIPITDATLVYTVQSFSDYTSLYPGCCSSRGFITAQACTDTGCNPAASPFVNTYYCPGNPGESCSSAAECGSNICNVNCCTSQCSSDGWYCSGNAREWRDYFCSPQGGACDYVFSGQQDCSTANGCGGDGLYYSYFCSSGSCIPTPTSTCSDCSCSCGGYNAPESIANGNCADGKDNNCNGESDYDSSDGRHGDSGCPVSVSSSMSLSSSSPAAGSSITVDCGSSVFGINSISASVDGVGSCVWQSWVGSAARFSCNVGPVGSKTVRCFVDTSKSYVSGTEQSATINVLPASCPSYSSSSSCEADSSCDWCPDCVGVKYTGSVSRCVDANTCPAAFCWSGQCGASCDYTNGGCSSSSICDAATCSCVCADDCSTGSRQCSGLNAYQTCGSFDADSCLDWSSAVSCPFGESCNGGFCCADQCSSSGLRQCSGLNSYQVCGEFDSDPCLEWGSPNACSPGTFCSSSSGSCTRCGVGELPCVGGSCGLRCGSCGNGIVEQNSGELCEQVGGAFKSVSTCSGLGFGSGSLACASDCHFDTTSCSGSSGVCGNGILDVGEECDSLDWGLIADCADLGFAGGVLDCTSDCKFNTLSCYDVPACTSSADCPVGAVCGLDGRCGCPDSTDVCLDGSCNSDCSSNGDFRSCVVQDGICNPGEGCSCPDCTDGTRASCDFASACFQGLCRECTLGEASWDASNCLGDVCAVANSTSVDLVAFGSAGCVGRSFKFNVFWKGDSNDVVGHPPSSIFGAGRGISSWLAFWKDASFFGGLLGAEDPIYEFYARVAGIGTSYSTNRIKVCDQDADCDGVPDDVDQCDNTPLGEAVDGNGCTPTQAACIASVDCSSVPWSECNDVTGKKTRDICRNPLTGQPVPGGDPSCCDQQSTCLCTLGSCTGNGNWIPTSRGCLVEEEFPFFTALNIFVVVALLVLFYFLIHKKARVKKSRRR